MKKGLRKESRVAFGLFPGFPLEPEKMLLFVLDLNQHTCCMIASRSCLDVSHSVRNDQPTICAKAHGSCIISFSSGERALYKFIVEGGSWFKGKST